MSSLDECRAAQVFFTDFMHDHPWKTRKIQSVGIGLASNYIEFGPEEDSEVKDFVVVVGVSSDKLPPRYASDIENTLVAHGLGDVVLRYETVSPAIAHNS